MTNIAVILAGGTGKRFGDGLPKQLRKLEDGRTVLQTCIDAFRACPLINQVLVVMHPDWINSAECRMLNAQLIPGGQERWESSWNAIQYLSPLFQEGSGEAVNVLIHDAARPYVSARIIEEVCEALETHEAVTVAIPATDTMYECTMQNAQCTIARIPDRATMMRAQTPQAFRLDVIKRAYELAIKDPNLQVTDDCGIVKKHLPKTPIYIIAGEEQNRKITFKEDLTPST